MTRWRTRHGSREVCRGGLTERTRQPQPEGISYLSSTLLYCSRAIACKSRSVDEVLRCLTTTKYRSNLFIRVGEPAGKNGAVARPDSLALTLALTLAPHSPSRSLGFVPTWDRNV